MIVSALTQQPLRRSNPLASPRFSSIFWVKIHPSGSGEADLMGASLHILAVAEALRQKYGTPIIPNPDLEEGSNTINLAYRVEDRFYGIGQEDGVTIVCPDQEDDFVEKELKLSLKLSAKLKQFGKSPFIYHIFKMPGIKTRQAFIEGSQQVHNSPDPKTHTYSGLHA